MPEEINRILTDAISDLLFLTEVSAEANLLREGIAKEKIHFVGNTMVDTLFKHRHKTQGSNLLSQLGLQTVSTKGAAGEDSKTTIPPYALVTLHRPSNVDDKKTFPDFRQPAKKWTFARSMARATLRRHIFEANANRFSLIPQVHRSEPCDHLRQQASIRDR